MRCDAVDGCQDYGGTGTADFGEDFWPGPSLRLETMVALNGDTAQPRGHLTPLTTLSTTLFERVGASDGWAGFQQAQRQVETRFGLQAGRSGSPRSTSPANCRRNWPWRTWKRPWSTPHSWGLPSSFRSKACRA